jgi:ADP-ribose pyrophosphatase YjhB (NUDIX family)
VLSPVSVRARAVIPRDGGIVVARERRRGRVHLSIPGGRVSSGETVANALVREVREETGLEIRVGRLLYVAEVKAPVRRHDLNLVFLAVEASPGSDGVEVVDPDGDEPVLPPILGRIREDRAAGWAVGDAVWLGNVWDSGLRGDRG